MEYGLVGFFNEQVRLDIACRVLETSGGITPLIKSAERRFRALHGPIPFVADSESFKQDTQTFKRLLGMLDYPKVRIARAYGHVLEAQIHGEGSLVYAIALQGFNSLVTKAMDYRPRPFTKLTAVLGFSQARLTREEINFEIEKVNDFFMSSLEI